MVLGSECPSVALAAWAGKASVDRAGSCGWRDAVAAIPSARREDVDMVEAREQSEYGRAQSDHFLDGEFAVGAVVVAVLAGAALANARR
jgi:hypothetical protein